MAHPRSRSSVDVAVPLIHLVGVSKAYMRSAGGIQALSEICLQVQKGDLVAVVGPSGSGKSTLMNLLGLLDMASAGHYGLAGRDVSRLSADEQASIRNTSIGFIYQAFNLLARSTAIENVELPLVYGGARKKDRQRRALQALEEVGLTHRRDHWPHELSGGEQQRVAIARALVTNPELILADEPTGALDSKTGAEILRILQGLNQRGITVIIVTHNPSVAAQARRIVELADGRIVRDEKVESTRRYPPQPAERLNEGARGPVTMAFAEGVRAALRALQANILRTGLTMLGIIIGVAAVITMVAIGSGAQQRVEEEIRSLGANLLLIQPGSQRSGGLRLAAGTRQTLTEADAASIAREIEDIEAVAPGVSATVQVVHGNRNWSTNLAGITPEYLRAREWPIAAGRSFSAPEVASGAKVVLLGATVAQELFGNTDPIGRIVRVDNVPMNVIGTLSKKGQSPFGRDQDDVALVPISTAKLRILSGSHAVNRGAVDTIMIKVSGPAARSAVQDQMATLLRMRHRLRADAEDDFQIRDLASIASAQSEASRSLTIMLAAVAAVSLVVGGIGIMNIMLIAVHERTREIGLRMALGARRRDIRRQFLIEVAIVCALGGVVGVGAGTAAALAISRYAGWDVHVSPGVTFAAVAFATAVGVFFGLYPAARAGRMDPIAALRFE